MTKFLAAVLSVIAVGVLLIAYGLLSPRAAAFGPAEWPGTPGYQLGIGPGVVQSYAPAGQPVFVGGYQMVPVSASSGQRLVYGAPGFSQPVIVQEAPPPVARRTVSVRRDSGRNWKKAALLVGGSTATGAGVGAIFGGKKGALIGAAIGGGASTLYESTK
jgi:hypothetical protein